MYAISKQTRYYVRCVRAAVVKLGPYIYTRYAFGSRGMHDCCYSTRGCVRIIVRFGVSKSLIYTILCFRSSLTPVPRYPRRTVSLQQQAACPVWYNVEQTPRQSIIIIPNVSARQNVELKRVLPIYR